MMPDGHQKCTLTHGSTESFKLKLENQVSYIIPERAVQGDTRYLTPRPETLNPKFRAPI